MGLNLFSCSSSSHDRRAETNTRVVEIPNPLNPDPRKFFIERTEHIGNHIVVQVKYPNCKNYEGRTILVFNSLTLKQLTNLDILDPHFSSEKPELSPIARFVPTADGWDMAIEFVHWKEDEQPKPKHNGGPDITVSGPSYTVRPDDWVDMPYPWQ